MEGCEFVIVGGGIAGASLAAVLARQGREVVVLEATESFDDRVRGESMMPWGVREAQQLGAAEVLHAAGAHTSPLWRRYTEAESEPRDIPVGLLVAGVGGTLNLAHPVACQALLDAALQAGATVLRGIKDVTVEWSTHPSVGFLHGGAHRSLDASVVIGADGRASAVRRSAAIRLEEQAATGFVAGLLLDGVQLSDDHDLLAEHDHGFFLLLHQGHQRARAYHVVPLDDRRRYAGATGPAQFLRDASTIAVPGVGALAEARPAGPCAAFPGTDTWTARPFADGVVLIGDAAGHNDPTVGCGLSVAMRDARMVGELLLGGATRASDFAAYGDERMERMRRLRLLADLVNAASVEDGGNRAARRKYFSEAMAAMDPAVFPLLLGMYMGPETMPPEAVDESIVERVRAA